MQPSPLASAASRTAVTDEPEDDIASPALAPRNIEQLRRLQGDLKVGLPVLLREEDGSALVALVETLTEERYAALKALGQPELLLTRRRAEALRDTAPVDTETVRLRVPGTADLAWLTAVSGQAGPEAPTSGAVMPAMQPGAPLHETAIGIAKTVQAMPAMLAVQLTAAQAESAEVADLGLSAMPLDLAIRALETARNQSRVSSARLPMDASAAGRLNVFRPDDGGTEHYGIEIGTPDLSQPVTVRLHSACFTGDVLGSLKCDCGPQLRAAMTTMAEGGGGVLLYLNQEGRGIGLANKMRAYALQDSGLDTVEANHWLGFEDDQRDFRIGAQILRRMGIARVRLLTNNPAKVASLNAQGIEVVERVPLRVGQTAQNAHYLATKGAKSGHLL